MRAIYEPNALIKALGEIKKLHPVKINSSNLTDSEIEALVRRIAGCALDEVRAMAYSFTGKEIFGLCEYVGLNRYHVNLDNIVLVLAVRMRSEYYEELFKQWQAYPCQLLILKLLAENDTRENHGESIHIPVGMFEKWYQSDDTWEIMNDYICQYEGQIYEEKFQKAGFNGHVGLYDYCFRSYLEKCERGNYEKEGDVRIAGCVSQFEKRLAEKVWTHFLICESADRKEMVKHEKCFEAMWKLWKVPDIYRFPENQLEAFRIYSWWYKYNEVTHRFATDADRRRIDFWTEYLDQCELKRLDKHKMIIFNFDKYCAVEFEKQGTTYLFPKDYYINKVHPYALEHSTVKVKSFLWNNSHSMYRKLHTGRWESDLASKLQSYI